MREEQIKELSVNLDKEKLRKIVSIYLEAIKDFDYSDFDENEPDLEYYDIADSIYSIIFSSEIYEECVDEFLEEVGDIDYKLLDLKIDENIEKLIKITNIYDDTHEWGCNDTAKYLYTKLICSIF